MRPDHHDSRFVLQKTALTVCISLLLAAAPERGHAGDETHTDPDGCVYTASAGTVTANFQDFVDGRPDCNDCSGDDIPTLEIDEDGLGNFNIFIEHATGGTCTASEPVSSTSIDVAIIFNSATNASICAKGTQSYQWYVEYDNGFQLELDPIFSDQPESLWLWGGDLVSSSATGSVPLFTATGDYEIKRCYEDCDDAFACVSIPLHVEVAGDFGAGQIRFEDDPDVVTLFEFSDDCTFFGSQTIAEPVRYLCSGDDPPAIAPQGSWDSTECGIASHEWQKFDDSGTFALWEALFSVNDGQEDPYLTAEDVALRLPSSGSLLLRRADTDFEGKTFYTNELEIVIVKDLEPVISPTAQNVCQSGTLEDLTATFDQTPIGDVRHQWQERLPGVVEWTDLAEETGSTLTPTLQAAEYRVKLWQEADSGAECGPYTSDVVRVLVGPNARPYYPDADGDGFPDKSGDVRLLCEVEDGWVPALRDEDCDDTDPELYPGKRYYFDEDGDGFLPEGGEFVEQCERPRPLRNWITRTHETPRDCDDTDPQVTTGFLFVEDQDRDGYSTGDVLRGCSPPPGYRLVEETEGPGDCDDDDRLEHPGQTWFQDVDGDRHGGTSVVRCSRPQGGFLARELATTDDCDDDDPEVAREREFYRDADGDGYPAGDAEEPDFVVACRADSDYDTPRAELVSLQVDCNDDDPERFPGQTWYPDDDGDGFGDAFAAPALSCAPPTSSHVSNHRDCDDADSDPARCAAGPDAGAALQLRSEDEASEGVHADGGELGKFHSTDFRIEAWIRTAASRRQAIVTKGSPCGDRNSWSLYVRADGAVEAVLLGGEPGKRVELTGSTTVADGEWHHIVLRRTDDEFALWVDLAREAVEVSAPFTIGGTAPVIVGNDLPLGGEECLRGFIGLIDNVRIWTGSELNGGPGPVLHHLAPGDTPGLVAHWSFDQTVLQGSEPFAVDSAQGFPLRLGAGELVTSTAPLGVGSIETSVFLGSNHPTPDFEQPTVGVTVAGASIASPSIVSLSTRLLVQPAGSPTPDGVAVGDTYWILELLGPSTELSGDLTLTFPDDAIPSDFEGRPEDLALYTRTANSDGEWTLLASAPQVDATSDELHFSGVTLGRGQLVVTDSGVPPEFETAFLRGDCNQDGTLDISDGSFNLDHLFLGGELPQCIEACEANGDSANDLSDAVHLFTFLFLGGPPPVAPFPDCGIDPTPEVSLGCEVSSCP